MLMSVDLTSSGLDNNSNLFFSQKLPRYNNEIAFHYREFRRKRLIDLTGVYGGKVFIKIYHNGNKEETNLFSQLTGKFLDHIFN